MLLFQPNVKVMSHAAGSELSDARLKVARSLKLSTAERQRVDHPRLVMLKVACRTFVATARWPMF